MSRLLHTIVIHRFNASAERVFDACLDPRWVSRWMGDSAVESESVVRLSLEARVGGRFSFVVNRSGVKIEQGGEYREIDRPRLLVFTWATSDTRPETSRVIIEIMPSECGCDLKLTHVAGANWSEYIDRAAGAWSSVLDRLEGVIAREDAMRGA